jgi:hypothetical protein
MLPILAESFFRSHSVRLLAPLAAFRALEAALFVGVRQEKRPDSLLLTTAARETVSDCSLSSLRFAGCSG